MGERGRRVGTKRAYLSAGSTRLGPTEMSRRGSVTTIEVTDNKKENVEKKTAGLQWAKVRPTEKKGGGNLRKCGTRRSKAQSRARERERAG